MSRDWRDLRLCCLEKSQHKRIWYRPVKLWKEEKELLGKDHSLFPIAHKLANCQIEHLRQNQVIFSHNVNFYILSIVGGCFKIQKSYTRVKRGWDSYRKDCLLGAIKDDDLEEI